MFPDITSAVAADTQHDLLARAAGAQRVHLAHPARSNSNRHGRHLPQVGRHLRQWLAAGYL